MIDSSVLPPVMPAHAGIHDLPSLQQRKSWKPAFAGMTGVAARASMFRAVGITRKALSELVNGHTDMSRDMAIRLAKAFPRTDIRLWLDMQLQYDTWQAEQRASSIKVRPFPSPAPA
jgi:addiction module HigA family antidote